MFQCHESKGQSDSVDPSYHSPATPLATAPDMDTRITFVNQGVGDSTDGALDKQHIWPPPDTAPIVPESKDSVTVQVVPDAFIACSSPGSSGHDPNLVDWQPEDLGRPQNWKQSRKWIAIAIGVYRARQAFLLVGACA